MDTFRHDIRYGLRTLMRNPGFMAVAVLTLALGIGANSAIFSVVDAVLLRPLPFRAPDQLVALWETESAPGIYPLTGTDFIDWRAQNHSFEDICVFTFQESFNASGAGETERAAVVETQADFFSILGVQPILGRTFVPGEDSAGLNRVALLSYGFWQRHFGGDRSALGKKVELNGEAYEVVGVLPAWYRTPGFADLWIPIDASPKALGPRGEHHLRALGRVKNGMTVEQARADLRTVSARLEKQYPDENSKVSSVVMPMKDILVGNSRTQLWIMFGAVTLVLLIACVNVANLLLARSTSRRREIAVRAALGADRWRLIRQLLTESVMLSIAGAIPGIGLAYLCVAWLRTAQGIPIPQPNPIGVEPIVLLFTLGVSVVVGVLFGLMPALQTSRVALSETLTSGGKMGSTANRGGRFVRDALVTVEIALSLALLAGAGLLVRTFTNLREVNIGVHADRVLTAKVLLPPSKYSSTDQQNEFYERLVRSLSASPGVESAALASELPLEGGNNGYVMVNGQSSESMAQPLVEWTSVTPNYFRVMGIPLIAGRDLMDADLEKTATAARKLLAMDQSVKLDKSAIDFELVAVISQAMAREFWPDKDPLGQIFIRSGIIPVRVIGVVGDIKQFNLRSRPMPQAYFGLPWALGPQPPAISIVMKGAGEPLALAGSLRATVQSLDETLAIFQVSTMPEIVSNAMNDTNYQTLLLGIFAGLALLLASVGIYGVLSFVVSQRTSEIGIRMALGAGRDDILWMVLRQGFVLTAVGIGVGIAATVALTSLLESLLFGVKPTDTVTLIAVSFLMALVATAACLMPAFRATRVDPMTAVRYE